MATVSVRYIVDDVDAAIDFYCQRLGFEEVMHPAPTFAMLSRGDLRLVLSEHTDHYNGHRPHRALCQSPPAGHQRLPTIGSNVRVLRRDRLGGLIREYAQVA